jgi:hypothetical protein
MIVGSTTADFAELAAPCEDSARRMVSVMPSIGPDLVSSPAASRARSIVEVIVSTLKCRGGELK